MQVQAVQLKPLSNIELSADEQKILTWLRRASWQPQKDAREPIPYKAKVPEFYTGVRMYGGTHSALDVLIKKLAFQGIISKQELYPVTKEASGYFLSLKKADLDHLGVGQEVDEDGED